MEIITLVLSGALTHRDSLGHEEILRPGEVQVMTAGRGIEHSEFNPSPDNTAHFLQIWITPERRGLMPSYAQRSYAENLADQTLVRIAGPKRDTVEDHALTINQDADILLGALARNTTSTYPLTAGRALYLHVLSGTLNVAGEDLTEGDAITFENAQSISLSSSRDDSRYIAFDVAMSS